MLGEIGDGYALYSYERLRLEQPHLKVDGIYKDGSRYYIKCDDLEIAPVNSESKNIVEVFNKSIRVIGCYIELVTEVPKNACKMDEIDERKIINLSGNPLNLYDFNSQLSLILSNSLPQMWVEFNHQNQGWSVLSERKLSDEEESSIKKGIYTLCGYSANVNFKIGLSNKNVPKINDGLYISVSRFSRHNYSSEVINKWEADEQIWSDNKQKLFSSSIADNLRKKKHSACLINGMTCKASNIRNYLTLFSEVNIIVPPESKYEELLNSLDVTKDEILKLLEFDRVKLIFPMAVNRYNKEIIENAIETNPTNVIFSRELAYRTVLDLKCRNPIVFIPKTIEERQKVLAELLLLASNTSQGSECVWINGLVKELSNTWSIMHEMLSIRGAMGTFNVGLGPIINSMIRALTNKDNFLEIMLASNSIEWAAANQAVLCPSGALAKNEINLAYLYSGVRDNWKAELITDPNIATEGILTIAKYVPVLELAQAFSGAEIDRFRKIVVEITNSNRSEDISEAIRKFNESVKVFEKRDKYLDAWDIKGIILDATQSAANITIPFSGFLIKKLENLALELENKYEHIGDIAMLAKAKLLNASPNVVLVSKMRDKVKDML